MSGLWGISSVGRAPALQAGCQEFESPILHSFLCSSAVEPSTVNRLVPGSNPGGGVKGVYMIDLKGNYFYSQYPYKKLDQLKQKIEELEPEKNPGYSWGNFCSLKREAYLANDFKELLLQPVEYFAFETGMGFDVEALDPWVNKYEKGHFQEIHNHPTADLAVVVFLNDGPDFGQFYFHDIGHTQFNPAWYPILEKLDRGSIWIPEVKAGDVIVFPSHMMHGVSPHKSDIVRETFAYNVIFKSVY